jgi:hypothetical protein
VDCPLVVGRSLLWACTCTFGNRAHVWIFDGSEEERGRETKEKSLLLAFQIRVRIPKGVSSTHKLIQLYYCNKSRLKCAQSTGHWLALALSLLDCWTAVTLVWSQRHNVQSQLDLRASRQPAALWQATRANERLHKGVISRRHAFELNLKACLHS